jgi:adenylate cyclase
MKARDRIWVGISWGIVLALLWTGGLTSSFDLRWQDYALSLHALVSKAQPQPLAVVEIDQKSLLELGQWPWPRSQMGRLISSLSRLGAKTIAVDVLWQEPGENAEDRALERAIEKAGNVIIAYDLSATRTVTFKSTSYHISRVNRSWPALEGADAGEGQINIWPDLDGMVRRLPLNLQGHKSLGLAAVTNFLGSEPTMPGQLPLRLRRGGYECYSAADILQGKVPAAKLRGKLVLVGVTAQGLDRHPVGLRWEGAIAGVYLQAEGARMILARDLLKFPDKFFGFLLILGLTICFSHFFTGSKSVFLYFFTFFILTNSVAFGALHFWSFMLPAGTLNMALAGNLLLGLVRNIIYEKNARTKLRDSFSRYLSPQLAQEVAEHPEQLALGGKRQLIAVLFADLRGFTAWSQKNQPQEVIGVLNRYLSIFADTILSCQGMVDKFPGDGVLGLFGAPVPLENPAQLAVEAAIGIQRHVAALQAELAAEGREALSVGISIALGEATVGFVGSEQRLEYTAVGSVVNLAARLEQLAEGGEIICDRKTATATKRSSQRLGPRKLAGFSGAQELYRILYS